MMAPWFITRIRSASRMVEKPVGDNKFEPYRGKYCKPGTGCVTIINDHLYEGRFSPRVNGKRISKNIYAAKREEYEEKTWSIVKKVDRK